MFSIVITERGGAQRQLDLDALEITIGRIEDNDVVLPRSNVSKRHARLVLKDDRYVLIDLKSTNGTYINGRRLGAPMLVGVGDKIYIGDFILSLQEPQRQAMLERRAQPRQVTQPLRSISEPPGDAIGAVTVTASAPTPGSPSMPVTASMPAAPSMPPGPPTAVVAAPPASPPNVPTAV